MSHTKFDQFNDLVTQLAAADGTLAKERSHELLDTELAREVLEVIVGGLCQIAENQYAPNSFLLFHGPACLVNESSYYYA